MNSKCKKCGNDDDLMTGLTNHQICGKCTRKAHANVVNNNPDVPSEVFDIEASDEIAQMARDFGL